MLFDKDIIPRQVVAEYTSFGDLNGGPGDLKEIFGCHDFLALQKPTLDQYPPAFETEQDPIARGRALQWTWFWAQ